MTQGHCRVYYTNRNSYAVIKKILVSVGIPHIVVPQVPLQLLLFVLLLLLLIIIIIIIIIIIAVVIVVIVVVLLLLLLLIILEFFVRFL